MQAQFLAECQEHNTGKPVLTLTIDDASHLPAVEAIIAVLYGITNSVAQLSSCQLVHAVQYADMLQVEPVAKEAANLLLVAAQAEGGLAVDALQALSRLVWPSYLLPVLPVIAGYVSTTDATSSRSTSVLEVLLAVLGN